MKLPKKWNEFHIIDEIGRGSYGIVYEAENEFSGESCAIKVIRVPQDHEEHRYYKNIYKDSVAAYYESVINGFVSEIEILKELTDNKNIVDIKDYIVEQQNGEEGWQIYIMMELLDEIYEVQFDEDHVIQLGIDICNALAECETRGIMHRDIKPENILVDKHGHFKLTDFGMAKKMDTVGTRSVKGTFLYMAPEQFVGERYDHQVDIYSLGLIMYQKMNMNREPFSDTEKSLICFKDREEAFNRRMSGERLPAPVEASEGLAEIILKACAYATDQRYKKAEDLKKDLWRLKLGTYKIKTKTHKAHKKDISFDKKKLVWRSVGFTAGVIVGIVGIALGVRGLYNTFYFDTKDMPLGSSINGRGVLKTDGACTMSYICDQKKSIDLNDIKKVIITDTCDKIYDGMFNKCHSLKEVVIEYPEAVLQIGDYAFSDCEQLMHITYMDHVQIIGRSAFQNCEALGDLILPETLEYMGSYAFYDCKKLEFVNIPEGIQEIFENTFAGCDVLKRVSIPASLQYIYPSAFQYCEALEIIEFPEGNHLKVCAEDAFFGCNLLEAQVIEDLVQ